MSRVSIYLNFNGKTEEAFNFYKDVFGAEFSGIFQRMSEVPKDAFKEDLPDEQKDWIMHVELPILNGVLLMGTDTSQKLTTGNNMSINLEPDTRAETERLFAALSEGGEVGMELTDMFWGGYFGSIVDKFGIRWMFNCMESIENAL